MRIFITGIAGFLGSHLADAMRERGHQVFGCDNLIGGDLENIPKDISCSLVDCRSMDNMTLALENVKPDVVYHCAALAHEGLSVFSPLTITDSIYRSSVSVMTASIRAGVKRFINMSSMSRYGTQDRVPFTEDMAPRPQDPYACAKVASEQTLKVLADVHGLDFVNCIPHSIVGPRQRYTDPFRNVASILTNRMLQGKRPIIYGDGSQERCFSDIRDVVPILCEFASADRSRVHGYNFNVGPDEQILTIKDLAHTLAAIVGFKDEPQYLPDRPQEVKVAHCSADRIRTWFGYKTKYDIRETLESVVAWIKEKGPKPFDFHLPLEIDSPLCPRTWSRKEMN